MYKYWLFALYRKIFSYKTLGEANKKNLCYVEFFYTENYDFVLLLINPAVHMKQFAYFLQINCYRYFIRHINIWRRSVKVSGNKLLLEIGIWNCEVQPGTHWVDLLPKRS